MGLAAALALQLAACGVSALPDATRSDAGADAPPEVGADTPPELGADTPPELGTHGPNDAGADAPDGSRDVRPPSACASNGTVTFRMQASGGDAGYTYVESFGNPGDGYWWYSVAMADGTPLRIFLSNSTTCGSCFPASVPIGSACSSLPAAGATADWDGTALTGTSTCVFSGYLNGPLVIPCDTSTCMPAGSYVVTMCAYGSAGGCGDFQGSGTCVSVPFDYPTTSEVVGTLPPY